ncbi:MAG: DNA gyrase inhibitor YacG [Nitrospirae bacterium]|nr:DNA gyrase inhibitor YacG [Nitrospirota bacterium]
MKVRIPSCHRESEWENKRWRPFCSERCQVIDLGAWAAEQYRIAGKEPSTAQELSPESEPTA